MRPVYVAGILGVIIVTLYLTRKPLVEIMSKLTRSQFITKYGPVAKSAAAGTTLFPSVFIAQAILESGNGNSSLSKEANNFFGIKADGSWSGPYIVKNTAEVINGATIYVQDKFRKYDTPLLSFLDRVNFLIKNTRYKTAGVFSAHTPEQQAAALLKAGYATDPEYSNKLISIINSNNLKQFDT